MEKAMRHSIANLFPEPKVTLQQWIEVLNHQHLPTFASQAHLKSLLHEVAPSLDFKQPLTSEVKDKLMGFHDLLLTVSPSPAVSSSSSSSCSTEEEHLSTASEVPQSSQDLVDTIHILQAIETVPLKPFQKILLYLDSVTKFEDILQEIIQKLRNLLFCHEDCCLTVAETLLLRQIARESFESQPSSQGFNASLQRLHSALVKGCMREKGNVAALKPQQWEKQKSDETINSRYIQQPKQVMERPREDMFNCYGMSQYNENRPVDWRLFQSLTAPKSENHPVCLPKIKTIATSTIPIVSSNGAIHSSELLMSTMKKKYTDHVPTTFSPLVGDPASFWKVPSTAGDSATTTTVPEDISKQEEKSSYYTENQLI